jgi:hypothetical protein
MRSPTSHRAVILPTSLNSITGAKEEPSPSSKKALGSLPNTPSPLPTPQSKRQIFDYVLLPSPRKSGLKLANTLSVTEGAILPRSRTTSPVPNAHMAALRRKLRPVPRSLSKDETIQGEDDGHSPSKRVKKEEPLISRTEWEGEYNSEPEALSSRGRTRSALTDGKEIVRRGRGWVVIEEDVTSEEELARSSKAERASAGTSRSRARQFPDVFPPPQARSKRRSPVKKKQTKKTPQRVKSTSPIPSSPLNPFGSTGQSEATTDVDLESDIDPGTETDTTSYSLKFNDPFVAQSPRSTVSSLAIPVPSDFETDVGEPEEYIPAIRQSSTFTPSVIGGATEDDPEMELDEPDFRLVMSPSKVLRGPLPHHLYHFVPLQKKVILQRLRNPPYVELGGDRVVNGAGKELRGLLEGTMERGEGNSCLILGPRGSGKSLVGSHRPFDLFPVGLLHRAAGRNHTQRFHQKGVCYSTLRACSGNRSACHA